MVRKGEVAQGAGLVPEPPCYIRGYVGVGVTVGYVESAAQSGVGPGLPGEDCYGFQGWVIEAEPNR